MEKVEIDLGWATLVIRDGYVDVLVRGLDSQATVNSWHSGEVVSTIHGNCFTVERPGSS